MDIRDDLAALRRRIKRQLASPGEFVRIIDEDPDEGKGHRKARKTARHGARHPASRAGQHGKAHR